MFGDDLKFDFWFRLQRHQQIFNEVMKRSGNVKNNFSGNDCTEKLLQEMYEKNKGLKPMELNLDFDWSENDDD